jgi:hypothetical protein
MPLAKAELSNIFLARADLRSADLSDADLRHADLSKANLQGTDLRGADLGGAALSGADSSSANLGSARISQDQLEACASLFMSMGAANGSVTTSSCFGLSGFRTKPIASDPRLICLSSSANDVEAGVLGIQRSAVDCYWTIEHRRFRSKRLGS